MTWADDRYRVDVTYVYYVNASDPDEAAGMALHDDDTRHYGDPVVVVTDAVTGATV
jgi:predicted ribosome quality control (RQC) complex YloA/Tae2 family protein